MIPKNEMTVATYADAKGNILFIVTRKIGSDTHFLYEILEGKEKKLGKSDNPIELEKKFNIRQRVGAPDE